MIDTGKIVAPSPPALAEDNYRDTKTQPTADTNLTKRLFINFQGLFFQKKKEKSNAITIATAIIKGTPENNNRKMEK